MEKRAADQDFRSINSRLSIRVHGQFYSSAKPTPLLRVFASPPPPLLSLLLSIQSTTRLHTSRSGEMLPSRPLPTRRIDEAY